jgi:hypothetical protein
LSGLRWAQQFNLNMSASRHGATDSVCRKDLLDSHLAPVTGAEPPFAGIDALGASTASPQVCSFGTKL